MSSASDSEGEDEELNELRQPKTWDDVADDINDEEVDDVEEIYFTGRSVQGHNTTTSPSVFDEPGKFRDPLGILRGPPKGIKGKIPDVEEEGFDPVKVLSTLHSQTRYDELVAGARRLARKLSSQEEDIKQLVRDNFERFVSCKDVIDNLYTVINENEISTYGTGTVKLEHTYTDIVSRAKKVYGPLLVRQDESEKIRQALSVLQRFSFLFSLPSKISANIKSGDYEKAVQHYKKAIALAEDSKVGLFRKVMGEVESIISEFRATLYSSLSDPNASFETQVKIIRLLVELGRKSTDKDQEDPGWFYLQNTASRLIALLNESKSVRVMCAIVSRQIPNLWKMGSHYLGGKFDADSKQRAKAQAHPELNTKRGKDTKDSGKSAPIRVYYVNETFASLRVDPTKTCKDIIDQCMRRLPMEETEAYTESDFAVYTWIEKRKRDGTTIKVTELHGDDKLYKIHKKWGDSKSGNTHKFLFKRKDVKFPRLIDSRDKVVIKNLSDIAEKVDTNGVTIEKKGKVRSEPEFYSLVNSILQVFSTRVTEMLFADALDPDLPEIDEGTDPELPPDNIVPTTDQEWVFATMREDVTCVVSTQAAIQRVGVKEKPLVTIADLSLNICRDYVTRVCSQWAAEVSLLHLSAQKEHQKDGADTPVQLFSVTQLPNQFAATSRFYLSQLSGLNISGRSHPLHPQILSSLAETIKCFADCLHHLCFTNQKNIRLNNSGFGFVSQLTANDIHRLGVDNGGVSESNTTNKSDELALTRDGWMIAGLAHAEYARTQVIPSLWMYFLEEFKLGTADTRPDEEIMSAVDVIQLLGGVMLERYIHSKTLRFNHIIQKGLHLSGIDWGLTVPPTAVSEYVMTMLLHFVYVHSEVVSVSGNIANISSKVISPLISNALLGIHRAISQLEGFSVWGLWQIRLDISFFESILSRYISRNTDIISRNIRDLLDKYEEGGLADDEGYDSRKVNEDIGLIVDDTVKRASISFSCLLEKT